MGRKDFLFQRVEQVFDCPICHNALHFHAGTMVCRNGHSFDISAKGYINFIRNYKQVQKYDEAFFYSRRQILEAGFYDHIRNAVLYAVSPLSQGQFLVDAGCGEGYYAQMVARQTEACVFGFDFSRDAIRLAAKGEQCACWMVADLANIPLRNGSVDTLLNIFSPANYREFTRVLKHDGTLIKVIPGRHHLHELRHIVRENIRNEAYSNQQVVDYLQRFFHLEDRIPISKTLQIDGALRQHLLRMTPLVFGIETLVEIDDCLLTHITIEGEVLIGKIK